MYKANVKSKAKSKLVQGSYESWSFVDVERYHTSRAFGLQNIRSRFRILGGGITDKGWLIPFAD